ncbi:Pirin [Minicystis rosea]|nr:Pirin [Minicystis rosea]
MITLRPARERGHADFGWLNSHHTFSFGDYYDPRHMGFRSLRVINDDRVQGGKGFGTHPHRDMEIVSYVLEGALEHKDSMGTGSVIRPGDVQRMTAGTGVLHSEFNHSKTDEVHFLQIWILPERARIEPSYEQKNFTTESRRNTLKLIASNDGREGSVLVHQDVSIHAALLDPGATVSHAIAAGRHAWVHVASGSIELNGKTLGEGDGASVSDETKLDLTGKTPAEVLVFDLA